MPRPVLEESRIHGAIRARIAGWNHAIVDEVEAAVATNDVVVVGMKQNPFPARARKSLEAIGQPFGISSTAATSGCGARAAP